MEDMNTDKLARELARRTGLTIKDSETIIKVFIQIMFDSIASYQSLSFRGFGKIKITNKGPRDFVNPLTGEAVHKDEHYQIRFIPSKLLKEMVYAE